MLFSKRKGFTPVKDTIQKETMDDQLRHGLWNSIHLCIWENISYNNYQQNFQSANIYSLFQFYWHELFGLPLDNLPTTIGLAHKIVRDHFFKGEWYAVYDFIEFTANHCPDNLSEGFIDFTNQILEKELSAYRFIGGQLTDITSEEEIECIESAIHIPSIYKSVTDHLKTSLSFISDRKSPDYRNSIKESISAVESLCKIITDDPKSTLGAALKKIEKKHQLHPAFKSALSSLYGFTNDSGGIRHALLEEDTTSYSDAKFMLVSCSAFVNYLLGKISEES
ncbi:AbiJ-NTD4 domain-containing protein [Pseudoalteromonas marina]|uniref:AbiJ-NTD4 domain-containing protein n=1 Tax=Pseudoalteromonas marina TaxID=267375 RepID=UPI0023F1825B|nr:hypothetical protein [Pseudoalteromonas marina]